MRREIKFIVAGILIIMIILFPFEEKLIISIIDSLGPHGIVLSFIDVMGTPINNVQVEINAIPPPTLNETLIRVYLGLISGNLVLDLNNANFSKVVHAWVDYFTSKNDKKGYEVGLFISAWVIDDKGNVIAYKDETITYNPYEILKGGKIIHTIKINTEKTTTRKQQPSEASCGPVYYWETYQPFTKSKYGKIPILTVYNSIPGWSATLGTSISIDIDIKSVFGVSIGYGVDIINKVYSNIIPPISVTIEGSSIEGYFYYYAEHYVGPGRTFWTWINGTITHVHQREVRECTLTGAKTYTGNERILDYISELDVRSNRAINGSSEIFTGDPSNIIKNYYYNLKGFTEYGPYTLQVNEFRTWKSIFMSSSEISVSLGIALPVGAMIALILASLGVPEAYLALIAGLTASLYQYSTTSVQVGGGIINHGNSTSDGPYKSYNAPENLYIYATSYTYNNGRIPIIFVNSQ